MRSGYEMRMLPGLEKYSRDPVFDQNSVKDSGKLKILLKFFLSAQLESGIRQHLGTGYGNGEANNIRGS